jgi:hypothetical protein
MRVFFCEHVWQRSGPGTLPHMMRKEVMPMDLRIILAIVALGFLVLFIKDAVEAQSVFARQLALFMMLFNGIAIVMMLVLWVLHVPIVLFH